MNAHTTIDSPIVQAALDLAASGFPVFPCNAEKRPIIKHGFLDATTDPAIIRKIFTRAAKLIGVPTGPASGIDVLDFDYKHGAKAWEDENSHRLPETRIHQTKSGGRHHLYRCNPAVRNSESRIGPGVDVRGSGGYIIIPPSTGYSIISDAPLAPWPEWMLVPGLALPAPPKVRPVSSAGPYTPTSNKRLEGYRKSLLENVSKAGEGQKHLQLRSAARALGGIQAEAGFSDAEAIEWLMDALPDTVVDWANAKKTAEWALASGRDDPIKLEDRPKSKSTRPPNPPLAEDDGPGGDWTDRDDAPPEIDDPGYHAAVEAKGPIKSGVKSDADKPWTAYLQTNDEGEAINNLANAMTALRSAPELRGCFHFDEMLQVAVLVHPLPKGKPGILPRPVRDTDVSITQEWLQRHELRRLGKDIVHQAVALRAEEDAFHPIRDYLNGLRWDRKPRLNTWLAYYAGCEPDEKLSDEEKDLQRQYISAIGRMFLISMVARVMRPGCKVDYMLILESIQGEGKSTIGEILAGQWFSDSLPNIGSDAVRLSQHLRGKWLIEIGELSAMSKTETEDLKAFLTRKEEQFTPKYGRLEVTEPRQCVFMGTTNKKTYLRDETGARRFWPAKAGTIDAAALAEDRDQLFAEAVNAYRAGEQWWPDRDFEKKFIQPQQEARREADAWEQTIGDWLETPVEDEGQKSGITQRTTCTISDVAEKALRMEPGRLGTADQRRIAAALECLGWERGKRTMHGRPWVRGPAPVPTEQHEDGCE